MSATRVVPMPCRMPRWAKKEGSVIKTTKSTKLDDDNTLIFIKSALSEEAVKTYIDAAVAVRRVQGTSAFNSVKPRYEVFYTPTGVSYRYSRTEHATYTYPEHVTEAIHAIEDAITAMEEESMPHFGELDTTGDILYDATLKCGGRCGEHSDDERAWPIVVIFSLGQTRYLRLREIGGKREFNVEMSHNSVVVMAGDTFQKRYTHRVDFLAKTEPVGARLSLNVRYLPAERVKRQRT